MATVVFVAMATYRTFKCAYLLFFFCCYVLNHWDTNPTTPLPRPTSSNVSPLESGCIFIDSSLMPPCRVPLRSAFKHLKVLKLLHNFEDIFHFYLQSTHMIFIIYTSHNTYNLIATMVWSSPPTSPSKVGKQINIYLRNVQQHLLLLWALLHTSWDDCQEHHQSSAPFHFF